MTPAVAVPFVDLKVQDEPIRQEIEHEIRQVLRDSQFVFGPHVDRFERAFGAFLGAKHVIGVANGTDALLLALKALGIGSGDDVLIPANTFFASAEAVIHAGARPVLADIDPHTYNIDVKQIEMLMTPKVKAIIAVHLYGQPADLSPIMQVARRWGAYVIEDAAQAHGAEYQGRRTGSWGDVACFSFYPSKNLGAYGDGGAVVTNDDETALRVRKLSNHGGIVKYDHEMVGWNSRLDTLQAAILLVKLNYLDERNRMRQAHARSYYEMFSGVPGIVTPTVVKGAKHVYHLYVVRIERGSRDALREYLQDQGVQTSIHYPTPLHLLAALRDLEYRQGDFPVAEQCSAGVLSLPMYPGLGTDQIEFVANHVQSYMKTHT